MAINLGLYKDPITRLTIYDNDNLIDEHILSESESTSITYTILIIIIIMSAIFLWKRYILLIEFDQRKKFLTNKYTDNKNNVSCYPNTRELDNIINHKASILEELVSVIKVNELFKNSKTKLTCGKTFDLILDKITIQDNIGLCCSTYNLIKDITGLINASFCVLAPHSKNEYQPNENNLRSKDNSYDIHIPLIMPLKSIFAGSFAGSFTTKLGLSAHTHDENENLIEIDWNQDYFIFDNKYYHQMSNDTIYHAVTLLLTIEKKY